MPNQGYPHSKVEPITARAQSIQDFSERLANLKKEMSTIVQEYSEQYQVTKARMDILKQYSVNLERRLEEQQEEIKSLQNKIADNRQLRATVIELQEKLRGQTVVLDIMNQRISELEQYRKREIIFPKPVRSHSSTPAYRLAAELPAVIGLESGEVPVGKRRSKVIF